MGVFHGLLMPDDRLTVPTLGADIRALRKARGLTLMELAEALNRSVGWLSQVERDKSHPAIADLGKMAEALDVSVSSFLQVGADPREEGIVVRADARRPIGSRTEGLSEALLSPDLTDDFEMIHSTFAPGSKITEPMQRPTQEVCYIVSGVFRIEVNDQVFDLNAGDSFRIRGEPFYWTNPGDTPCEIIWVISPPVY
ncbi:MAG: XRE family transcriptional regulator [Pseudomonadota bacterium]